MNLYLRLILTWLRNRRSDARHYLHVARSRFRVLPHDLDAFGHMNNGRYLQIMDVARVEWMMQTGVAGEIRRQGWAPLLGGGGPWNVDGLPPLYGPRIGNERFRGPGIVRPVSSRRLIQLPSSRFSTGSGATAIAAARAKNTIRRSFIARQQLFRVSLSFSLVL